MANWDIALDMSDAELISNFALNVDGKPLDTQCSHRTQAAAYRADDESEPSNPGLFGNSYVFAWQSSRETRSAMNRVLFILHGGENTKLKALSGVAYTEDQRNFRCLNVPKLSRIPVKYTNGTLSRAR